jgi:hypothetical protein
MVDSRSMSLPTIKQFVLATKDAHPSLTVREIADLVAAQPISWYSLYGREAYDHRPYVASILRLAGYPTASTTWRQPTRRQTTEDRNWAIYWMRCGGATYKAIGTCYGLSMERVRQLCHRYQRLRLEMSLERDRRTLVANGLSLDAAVTVTNTNDFRRSPTVIPPCHGHDNSHAMRLYGCGWDHNVNDLFRLTVEDVDRIAGLLEPDTNAPPSEG